MYSHRRPDPAAEAQTILTSFLEREFSCHRCGAQGPELRDTDRSPGSVRYRLDSGALLLPFCPACGLAAEDESAAVADLARDIQAGSAGEIDHTPSAVYRCSDPACEQIWHQAGTLLPFRPVRPLGPAQIVTGWHPCPWCLDETPTITAVTHQVRVRATADLSA